MTLTPFLRKFWLTLHVALSVGFLGAVAAFLALGVNGLISQEPQTVRGVYLAMELITWSIIVPLSFASLVTGLVSSLGTVWGLFRHYWVLLKLLLTVLVAIVLLLQAQSIGYLASVVDERVLSGADHYALRISLVVHAAGGLLVLLVITTLSVYKPQGLTRYGWRTLREQGTKPRA
ncbi:MAG: hypothetical protein WEB63_07720 [Cucumibacter sp.]